MIDILLNIAVAILCLWLGWNFFDHVDSRLRKVDNELKSLDQALDFNIGLTDNVIDTNSRLIKMINSPSELQFKKLTTTATQPEKAHEYDAGFDLFADEHQTLKRGQQLNIKTGIAVDIPQGYCGIVTGRSGLSSKTPLRVKTGVIDHGYTGEISVMCDFNSLTGVNGYHIEKGAKIAQLLIIPIALVKLSETDELPDYERGANGFGSTGK